MPTFHIRFKPLTSLGVAALFCACALVLSRASLAQNGPPLPTLFVVGDSTARNNANGAQGWGDPFKTFFDASKISVLNRAMAGRSTRTFISEGRWDNVLKEMKAGDLVLLQLGHNDGGPIDSGRARASLPGLGDETREVVKADGSKEVVHTYGWNLRKMVADTRAKGATPILLSLTVRNLWKEGKVEHGSGNYAAQIADIAKSQNAPFVDVTSIIADRYNALGEAAVKPLFGPDYVHTSPEGAELNAASVVSGLKAMPDSPFTPLLSDKGKAVAAYVAGATPAVATPVKTANDKPRNVLPVPADPALPTLFFIGDSTVRNGQGDGSNGQWGWGEPIAAQFDQNKINVVNRAVGGLSSRTYLTGGFWTDTLAMIKPGDIVMMQFGHNDSSAVNDDSRARGTIRGVGENAQEIDNLLTKQHETVHSYGWYLRRFISDAKAKGATPIVCSPIPRNSWTNGKINRNDGSYGGWAQQVAKSEHVSFVPLNDLIARRYDELGQPKVEPLFHGDSTHTSLEGAKLNAESVVEGLKALPNDPLALYFAANAATVPATNDTQSKPLFRLNFGSGQTQTGFTSVAPDAIYSTERGFGFEPGTPVSAQIGGGVSGDKPFFFSVALPEGNYNVTVSLGDQNAESTTTVKAEQRRLMLEQVRTKPGQTETRAFTVNIRTPQISTGGQVHLKDREKVNEIVNWDDKLTLEFNGSRPSLRSLQIARADKATTVYLLGDSTVCDQPGEPYNSWGQMLPRFFKAGVAVANNAQSGESLRSSLGAKRLEKVLSTMKAGDYAFIQFGHNDMKQKGEGVGAFTTYTTDLKHYADEVRAKGGIPVLVTPVNRRTFDAQGQITNSLGDYPEAVRHLAQDDNLALIDLNAMSKPFYEALGPSKSKLAFAPGDGTHHNNYGSYQLARCVVEGIRQNKLGLVSFLSDDATPFDPAHPDALETFAVPASPSPVVAKPDGN